MVTWIAPSSLSAKAIRIAAGHTQASVAYLSCTSLPTVRLYEADRSAVSARKRAALDRVYLELQTALTGEVRHVC
jgi:hypothetical protein